MIGHSTRLYTLAASAGALLAIAGVQPAIADEVADFYNNKTITMYIGYSAGGGYDTYARLLSRHMGRHIPGNPNFVAQNRPGAGSMVLTNQLYNTLPKDGTSMATIGRGMPMEPLFGNPQAKFKPVEFGWIGSLNNEVSVCASWHTTGITTFQDLRTRGMIVGGTGRGADTDLFPTALNNVMGTKLKLITGYPGGNDINFAIEKGEVEGRCGWSWSSVIGTRLDWFKEKKINVLVQLATEKHPDLPDVPLVMDIAESEQDKDVLELIFARQLWGRPFLTTPGVPQARLAALRAAFDATIKDPKFIAEADKMRHEINAVSGAAVQRGVERIFRATPQLIAAAKQATEDESRIQIAKAVIQEGKVSTKITRLEDDNRMVHWEEGGKPASAGISGSRTTITIAGEKANRKQLKPGMSCTIAYKGAEASEIACN
jgi:tripartite-type tricarboxylate transporter receptor subunit TctC